MTCFEKSQWQLYCCVVCYGYPYMGVCGMGVTFWGLQLTLGIVFGMHIGCCAGSVYFTVPYLNLDITLITYPF